MSVEIHECDFCAQTVVGVAPFPTVKQCANAVIEIMQKGIDVRCMTLRCAFVKRTTHRIPSILLLELLPSKSHGCAEVALFCFGWCCKNTFVVLETTAGRERKILRGSQRFARTVYALTSADFGRASLSDA